MRKLSSLSASGDGHMSKKATFLQAQMASGETPVKKSWGKVGRQANEGLWQGKEPLCCILPAESQPLQHNLFWRLPTDRRHLSVERHFRLKCLSFQYSEQEDGCKLRPSLVNIVSPRPAKVTLKNQTFSFETEVAVGHGECAWLSSFPRYVLEISK